MNSLRLICDWDMVLQHFSEAHQAGPAIAPEALPLTRESVEALWGWHKRLWSLFEEYRNSDAGSRLDFNLDLNFIEREGWELWTRIRTELGDSYQVAYYSEIAHTTFDSPEEYGRAFQQGLIR